jgi:hypothetical protein
VFALALHQSSSACKWVNIPEPGCGSGRWRGWILRRWRGPLEEFSFLFNGLPTLDMFQQFYGVSALVYKVPKLRSPASPSPGTIYLHAETPRNAQLAWEPPTWCQHGTRKWTNSGCALASESQWLRKTSLPFLVEGSSIIPTYTRNLHNGMIGLVSHVEWTRS